METDFRMFQATLIKISIFIPIFIKATLVFFKPEWGSKNISHFSLSVPKRSNFGHYLQLAIAITNTTILEIVITVQKDSNKSFLLIIEVNFYTNVALKRFVRFFAKFSDDVTKKVNLH